ncbi:HEAT repeat-containing protein 6 [Lucilia cuprina]|uniref:HEAT repeat-containing protein 6 n=1 Tax=Lucilia cuprina TaxID=7375 RepID=UPI001F0601D0|nr:HEAT repeat-containing protein 6 [Lucilia cuprina]
MENSLLTAESILFHLRQNRSNKKDLQVLKLLENIEKHGGENKSQQHGVLEELLQLLTNATSNTRIATDDAIGCVIWMTYLQQQQKLPSLDESQFEILLKWILEQHNSNSNNTDSVCRVLVALGSLFMLHPSYGNKYFTSTLNIILGYISYETPSSFLIVALQCMDKILSSLNDVKLSDEQSAACTDAGIKLIQLHYGDVKLVVDSLNITVVILCTLQILHKIVTMNSNFAKLQVSELLGLAKAYFRYGVDATETSLVKPQKVYMSQQALYDSAEEIETVINSENARSCGGKTPKMRKPRSVVKNSHPNDYKSINRSSENRCDTIVVDIKLSDSEVSEPENATNRILFERSRKAKIRLASISLVGAVLRILERKTLFGYWHALFPSGSAESIDNLLYVAQHDPNLRCRSAALQVCAHLLYGSKGFLHQAEINVKRCPTTFIPFSVSLGYTVLAIYKSLTTILSSESSLPVLTQALKCLAVLVQASPFQQFERGFVQNFVKDVKPLIYHRDAAIQVSALMVMEFLVALPETTDDIAESVGLPATVKNRSKLHVGDEEIDIVDIEEYVDSEDDTCENRNTDEETNKTIASSCRNSKDTWLLRRVLHNLTRQEKAIATSVRIESLQVLMVMCSHFAMIKPHLTRVSDVLQHSLNDVLPDVRLYAARCIDACAYQISRYLLDNASCPEIEIRECNQFWLNMMPVIVGHIRGDSEEMTTVRITLCDALSNIGVLMYEHTNHSSQISLLSFLSGVSSDSSEESMVRAAAVRALAVFALYPSLRGDLVFIENTAELTLRLVKDSNLVVRVKSFWSLGNISDALIGKGTTELPYLRQEHISNDLLYRLINAATNACNDNDKVRCNAVRTLGNLLRLLTDEHFNSDNSKLNWRETFAKSVCKLTDCIRSSGNAKVKWNTCYAISNLMRNQTIFNVSDLNWQETLYSALCHVIVHHSNFKVRINASSAITNIMERSHFGVHYEKFWSSVLEAIEQSYNLDNFHEYNHRDSLQEQLCLALCHLVKLASNEDLPTLKKHILPHVEIIRNTWKRVINRMVPEKAAPLLSCPVALLERGKSQYALSMDQKNAVDFLIEIFSTE